MEDLRYGKRNSYILRNATTRQQNNFSGVLMSKLKQNMVTIFCGLGLALLLSLAFFGICACSESHGGYSAYNNHRFEVLANENVGPNADVIIVKDLKTGRQYLMTGEGKAIIEIPHD